ncbi:MAG: phosphodiester glycosidase family protein [Anaerolineales bacterium]
MLTSHSRPHWRQALIAIGLAIVSALACSNLPATAQPVTAAPKAVSVGPTAETFDSGWVPVVAGMERRTLDAAFQSLGLAEHVVVFRIVPEQFTLRVRYTPGRPAFVSAWEPTARLVINANFFDEANTAQGLLVSDGEYFGQSYADFGGMLGVDPDGGVRIRSLADEPFQPDEPLSQAVQGFPMLIRPGAAPYANDDGARARRTVVGQDGEGRLLVFVAPAGLFTLSELAAWLWGGDFGLVAALNLDGGGSTGYRAGANDGVDSLTPVPAVLAVYDR